MILTWLYRKALLLSRFQSLTKSLTGDKYDTALTLSPRSRYVMGSWNRSFISTARFIVHTNPSRTRTFSKTLFKAEVFENAGLICVFVWTENIQKNTEPQLENDELR